MIYLKIEYVNFFFCKFVNCIFGASKIQLKKRSFRQFIFYKKLLIIADRWPRRLKILFAMINC